ncbi:single-stranded DNA-binding protein [Desulfopila sp. IMCC35006]|uniref:single-stranded DNA-binding protein n=1 Tax=Desulfopila sp. IMCC35006 TaxID=2569542 RepID=UPI0010AD07A6|nr:single-stranded DNA-binding protein [Desulfopila sp. IMCC35006]
MNKAMVIGNLGNDPEMRYTQKGAAVATFSIATTEKWKDANGVQQEHTDWHKIVAWKGLAEICGDHLKKGSKVYIEGKMQTRKWEENGITRYTTEIIAKSMEMLGGKNFDKETASSSAVHGNNGDNPPSSDMEVPF